MPIDFPDFYSPRVAWPRRDWATKEERQKGFFLYPPHLIAAGDYYYEEFYTVPDGKIFYLAHSSESQSIKSQKEISTVGGRHLILYFGRAYTGDTIDLTVPMSVRAGETLFWDASNHDIVSGNITSYIVGWEEPASEPEKAKNDDPRELYRVGEFNHASVHSLPNQEVIILFSKIKEKKMHYLRCWRFQKPDEKKLASFKLNLEEAREIMDTIHTMPQNFKKVCGKYEKKYKLWQKI